MGANGRSYGVIVLDPPKLIPDRDEVAPGKRKYFDLNVLAMKLVEPGGVLVTCSCSGLLPAADFLGILRAAARMAGRPAQLLAFTGASADHPVALDTPEGAYLKVAWLRMGDPDGRLTPGFPFREGLVAYDDGPVRRLGSGRREAGVGALGRSWPSLTVENYVKTIALIAARSEPGSRREHRRAGAGALRLARDGHRHAQDPLRGEPGDVYPL